MGLAGAPQPDKEILKKIQQAEAKARKSLIRKDVSPGTFDKISGLFSEI